MEDLQNEVQNNENENGNEYQQYIDTITELKKNSVSKEKYEKLEKQNADLITALKEGNQINLVDEPEEESIDELRADLTKKYSAEVAEDENKKLITSK